MRVLLLTTHLNIGGISTYTIGLARGLKAKGIDVWVASSGGMLVHELTDAGISHINIDLLTKSELSPKVFKAIHEISRIVKKLDIDIIHSQTRITQVIGFFVAKLCGAHVITTCHGFFKKNIGRALLPCWGEAVIAISDAVQENLISYFKVDKKRIFLIYNGIEIYKFLKDVSEEEKNTLKDKFGIRKDCSIIGTIARFTPDKGYDTLLYALCEIRKQEPYVQLVLVGDGKEKDKIMAMAQRLNLSEDVVFIRPQMHTLPVLSIMDVFMFTPTRREGLGLVILEAMASGKPVVVSDVGGISSIVKHGINGFLVEPSIPELLVDPVIKLLKDKEVYRSMAHAARETVVSKFSLNLMVDRTEEVYKKRLQRTE